MRGTKMKEENKIMKINTGHIRLFILSTLTADAIWLDAIFHSPPHFRIHFSPLPLPYWIQLYVHWNPVKSSTNMIPSLKRTIAATNQQWDGQSTYINITIIIITTTIWMMPVASIKDGFLWNACCNHIRMIRWSRHNWFDFGSRLGYVIHSCGIDNCCFARRWFWRWLKHVPHTQTHTTNEKIKHIHWKLSEFVSLHE